ncbi:hypothetical protein M378DRAFT_184229 [Amanita muscaria Koide BX008]|uniref:Autophagy-related protein 9 n=1 Tax=Amanita muscaria (strain Koide BX008) TaxID=946122 RepID=A0A0C2X693_AMAMK|nr:hypothetical protein M378DRAFT_184229 [Amanita muscaria Koide BX008]
MSGSRSFQASNSILSASTSRPFLNMLNPMGRSYHGYTQASQTPLEEEDEGRNSSEEDLEVGTSQGTVGQGKVSWDAAGQNSSTLRPNIQGERIQEEESDDEVPQSLMIEAPPHKAVATTATKGKGKAKLNRASSRAQPLFTASASGRSLPPLLPTHTKPVGVATPLRPSEMNIDDGHPALQHDHHSRSEYRPKPTGSLDAYEQALWNWVNVYNLDGFLQEVYWYYEGKGIYSIALARGLNLLTVGFVIGFSTFLLGCIDYSRIRSSGAQRLSDVVIERCISRFSGFTLFLFLLFTAFYIWQIVNFISSIRRLVVLYNFYTHLLKIPDADIQTISWPEVVRRVEAIREENPITAVSSKSARSSNNTTTAKLDAHDIANRIMRQENYLIALFNKDLLDLNVPLPPFLNPFFAQHRSKGTMLTRALEWNLRFCLMEFLFDRQGRVRKVFLHAKNRTVLIEGLKRRFIFMGILNAIFAPFIVLYLLMYSFFRYFEEYHKDPSTIGGRRYTSYAQWKFREFNELPHFFSRRLHESYPFASMFIGQFPNEKLRLIVRFIAFLAGSFAAVLLLATVLDPDLFFHFEITPHRTVVFYLGVFTAILTAARGMIPDEHKIYDPELLMAEVIVYTHYMPGEWKGQLHSKKVHQEFGELFAMKILIFGQELLSVVLTPFVLWLSLPNCTPAIIDFFREFTVHVDGRGYVCSFAEFNFERHGNVKFGAPTNARDRRMISNEGKMEKSFLTFKAANPNWNPSDPSGSLYLSRMAEYSATHHPNLHRRRQSGGSIPAPGVHFDAGARSEKSLADKAQEYDRALRQSQIAASRKKAGLGSTLTASATGPSASLLFGGPSMAQSAMLGDSQGSIAIQVPSSPRTPLAKDETENTIPMEDLALDGGVGSGLGESYVDGAKRTRQFEDSQTNEDPIEDVGILGLLAQIYGKRDGPARVIG